MNWFLHLISNILYTLGWWTPKHSSAQKHEFWFKCPICLNFQFVCTDLDITNMLVADHKAIVHYEGDVKWLESPEP